MRKLEQNDYYKALDRFMAEAGITDDKKKSYCQYFTEGGGVWQQVKRLVKGAGCFALQLRKRSRL